jgi:hypothetical protein
MADDKVKVTIRLPRALARLAKHYAVARDQDLQDLIAAALAEYLRRQPAPLDPEEGRALLASMTGQSTDASRRAFPGVLEKLKVAERTLKTRKRPRRREGGK